MSKKSELDEQVIHKKQVIEDLEKSYDNWKEDVEEDAKRADRDWKRKIEHNKRELKNLEERIDSKRNLYDEKLATLEKASEQIEEISKTTPTVNK
jgi:hypothetical protein